MTYKSALSTSKSLPSLDDLDNVATAVNVYVTDMGFGSTRKTPRCFNDV